MGYFKNENALSFLARITKPNDMKIILARPRNLIIVTVYSIYGIDNLHISAKHVYLRR
jgi:hypothetical protein